MKISLFSIIHWLPRILSLLFLGLLCLMALSAIGSGYGFWLALTSFFLRLIPYFILGLAIFIAWRRELAGGLVFLFFGAAYYLSTEGNFLFKLPLTMVFILIGALFLYSHFLRKNKN